jgi:hypothetical protein
LFFFDDDFRHEVLQFFVAIIDDELLEPVGGQIFKAVNVQYAQDPPFAVLLDLHRLIDGNFISNY